MMLKKLSVYKEYKNFSQIFYDRASPKTPTSCLVQKNEMLSVRRQDIFLIQHIIVSSSTYSKARKRNKRHEKQRERGMKDQRMKRGEAERSEGGRRKKSVQQGHLIEE